MIYKNRKNQKYEEYWKYTASKIDFNNPLFLKSLRIIVKRIDQKNIEYKALQLEIAEHNGFVGKDPLLSARKEINTWVKNGFINPGLKNYHPLTKSFLESKEGFERDTLLAKIFIEGNKLSASATQEDTVRKNRVKFLLRTLQENKKLTDDDLLGMMYTNPDDYGHFMSKSDLAEQTEYVKKINAKDRKYNQVSHFKSILKCLNQYIVVIDKTIYFRNDFDEKQNIAKSKGKPPRSQAEQEIYRDLLILESNKVLGDAEDNSRCKCMLSGLPMSKAKIVASHIWDYRRCDKDAEYDPNNGLLLGENADYYFDSGKISFSDDGKVLIKDNVPIEWRSVLRSQKLNKIFLNPERRAYLKKHRLIHGFN